MKKKTDKKEGGSNATFLQPLRRFLIELIYHKHDKRHHVLIENLNLK